MSLAKGGSTSTLAAFSADAILFGTKIVEALRIFLVGEPMRERFGEIARLDMREENKRWYCKRKAIRTMILDRSS
jgi:hypothetical protein